jgi:phosphohistidine phosphatase
VKIYLVRHAESEDGPREDPTRALTETGHAQAKVIAGFLHRELGRANVVLCSYFKRAVDTAKPIAEALGAPIVNLWQLHPDGDPTESLDAIKRHGQGDTVVVTHHPLTNALIERLTGAKTDDVSFHHGHVAHCHGGKLHWLVSPHLVERDEAVTEAAIAVADSLLEAMPTPAHDRRNAALEKPIANAERAVRKHFKRQERAFMPMKPPVAGFREADADAEGIEASLRATLASLPVDELIADLFDDALSAALTAAATHTASDFAYSDDGAYASFEARYLANQGFAKIAGGIDNTTIRQVALSVARAYQDGADYQGIVAAIKHRFADFNDYRVNLIAQTELNNAYNAGIVELGMQAGADEKSWHTQSDKPCPSCVANEAAGRIPIRAAFPSGAQSPCGHPGCYCSLEVHASGRDVEEDAA